MVNLRQVIGLLDDSPNKNNRNLKDYNPADSKDRQSLVEISSGGDPFPARNALL